jgi:hypothetical protein
MNRKSLRAALAALVLGWSTTLVFAQQLGTAKDARAMLDRAIAALKSNEHTALSQFNDQNNRQFPVSHSVRLFANMLAGHITLQVFTGFVIMLGSAGILGVFGATLPFISSRLMCSPFSLVSI